jgi:hypothetical protein
MKRLWNNVKLLNDSEITPRRGQNLQVYTRCSDDPTGEFEEQVEICSDKKILVNVRV